MTTHLIDLSLTITLESSLHIGTGYGQAGYLDAVMTTDARGYPYVPGSSLKGRLRFYLRQLLPVLVTGEKLDEALVALFGSKEQSGALFFDNCAVTQDWEELFKEALDGTVRPALARSQAAVLSQRQTNVMISRLRGVALERHLFTVESAPAHLAFAGRIHGQVDGAGAMAKGYPLHICLLVAAIRACTHLGGRKSRGLGRCRLEIDRLLLDGQPVEPDTLLEALA